MRVLCLGPQQGPTSPVSRYVSGAFDNLLIFNNKRSALRILCQTYLTKDRVVELGVNDPNQCYAQKIQLAQFER
jgi:hypothetical protein